MSDLREVVARVLAENASEDPGPVVLDRDRKLADIVLAAIGCGSEEIELRAAEKVVEAAEAMFRWTDAYEDHMVGEDFAKRDEARNAFSRALTEYKQVAKGWSDR